MWTAFLDLDIHLSFFFLPLLGPSRSVQWQFNSGVGGGRREELSIPLFRWLSVTGWEGGDRGERIGSDPRSNVTHLRSAHTGIKTKYTFQTHKIYLGNCKVFLTQKYVFPSPPSFFVAIRSEGIFSADSKGERESLMGTFLQYGGGGHFVGTLLPLPSPGFPCYFLFRYI